MAKIPPLPAYLTKKDVQKLLEACEKFYAVELLGEGYRGYLATRWAIPALGYNWKNSREFFKDISALTQQDSAKDVYAVLSGWEGEAPLALPVQETQDISETVPRNLKELEEALDKAKSEKEKLALAKNYQFLKGKVAPETPKPETEPPAGEAPPKPEPAVSREAEEVPAAAPAPSVETYTVGIQIAPQAGKVFQKFANRVASAPVRAAIAFAGPTIAAQQGGVTASALTLWARGIKSGPLEKEVSKLEAKEAKEFDGLIKAIKNIETDRSLQTRIIQRAFPVERLSLVLKAGATQAQVNIFINPPEAGGVTAVPRRSFLGNLLAGAGQQVFGKIASKAVSGLASKAAGKLVGKGVGAAAGTAVGGPVGTAIGYAISWLTDKVVGKVMDFLREHRGVAYAILFLPVAGAGLLFGIPILTVAGGLGVAVSLTGGTGAAVAGLGGALQGLFGALGSIFVTSIATPVLVTLISIPVVVALILFIINSGAYIVPPLPSSAVQENPYIGVVKEVEPAGPFENSDIPVSVTYTITVTAKKGALTNVSFEHKCEVFGEDGTFECAAPLPDAVPVEISPVDPFVFTYSQTYGGTSYKDSLVANTFTVTADAPEEKGASATGLASIIIGNPPTGCYNVAGSWPAGERTSILAAVSNLIGRAPTYVARVCAAYGQVNLYFDPPKVCGDWGCAPGGNIIYFNSRGLNSLRNATFILAHESAHVLSYGNGAIFQSYRAYPGTLGELPICNYGGSSDAEGFAEAIANYVVRAPCLSGNPKNIEFVERHIFR